MSVQVKPSILSFIMLFALIQILLISSLRVEASEDFSLVFSEVQVHQKYLDIQFLLEPSNDPLDPLNGSKWAAMTPGSMTDYWVILSNIGPENNTYLVELDEPPRDLGWDWFIKDNGGMTMEVNLTSAHLRDVYGGGPSVMTLIIRVMAPIDASRHTQIMLGINATELGAGEATDSNLTKDRDEMALIIGEPHIISLAPTHPVMFTARPGEWLSIPLTLSNLGNKDVIEVEIYVNEDRFWVTSYRRFENHYIEYDPFLEFNWTELRVEVRRGESYHTELKFRLPPEWTGEGDVFQFRYVGTIVGTNFWQRSEIISVIGDDGDGVPLSDDRFPGDPTAWMDTDGDGKPDFLRGNSTKGLVEDLDDDNDGINDTEDDFPLDASAWKDTDMDGMPDEINRTINSNITEDSDDDNDGIPDLEDMYPLDRFAWRDTDGDGYPDEIIPKSEDWLLEDLDDDNDGYLDEWESFLGSDPKDEASTPLDLDGDGAPDGDDGNSKSWMDLDDDDDGLKDFYDAFPKDPSAKNDWDGDGKPDTIDGPSTTGLEEDLDDDNDGVPDSEDLYPFDPDRSSDAEEDAEDVPWNWIIPGTLIGIILITLSFILGRSITKQDLQED
jgi:hypothetical protein